MNELGSKQALGWARGTATIAALTFLVGFATDLYRPAIGAIVTDLVPAADRLRAFSLIHWAANLGFAIAPVVAGLLAGHFAALFNSDAATALGFAVLAFALIRETRQATTTRTVVDRGMFSPLLDPVFLPFVALTFAAAVMFHQSYASLPMPMAAQGIPPSRFGLVIAVNGALIGLGLLRSARVVIARAHLAAAPARRARLVRLSVEFD